MELDPQVVELYHEYLNAPLRRRIFLLRLSQLVGSDEKALALVPVLESSYRPDAPANGKRKSP
jgi:hypothetical protein